MADPRDIIRNQASALGFDVCRFASASDPWSAGEKLAHFVEAGRHGEMGWMETTLERRAIRPPCGTGRSRRWCWA